MDDIQPQKRSRRGGGRDARRTARQTSSAASAPIWFDILPLWICLAMKPVS